LTYEIDKALTVDRCGMSDHEGQGLRAVPAKNDADRNFTPGVSLCRSNAGAQLEIRSHSPDLIEKAKIFIPIGREAD